jgi:phosphoserine phosphatase RsbU-like protein/GAF domain-containing protein
MGKTVRFPPRRGSDNVPFRAAYGTGFQAFLADPSETALRTAYELGREAVTQQVGLLELAQTHHDVVLASLADIADTADAERITRAASDFLLEALSAYEMVRRAVAEAHEAVQSERRQAEMIRQLSSVLADTSLAVQTRSSIEEMLQLVAEQTHELVRASWCIAHAYAPPRPTALYAVAGSDPVGPESIVEQAYAAFTPKAEAEAKAVRIEIACATGEVLALLLCALDGATIGLLAIEAQEGRRFTDLDRAVFVHIGQTTAAALERAMRYPTRSGAR